MAIRPWSLVARRRSGRARIFLFFSASLTQPLLLCFTFGKYFRQNHRLLDQMTCFVPPPSQQRQALDQILELNNSGDCSQHPGKSEQISILKESSDYGRFLQSVSESHLALEGLTVPPHVLATLASFFFAIIADDFTFHLE